MILASIRIQTSSASGQQKLIELLRSVAGPLSAQPGLVSVTISSDILDSDIIIYQELWREQAALDKHIASDRYSTILTACDLGSVPPDIQFLTITETKGMNLIKNVRAKTH